MGWITFLVLTIGEWGLSVGTGYFTPFAPSEPKHIFFRNLLWSVLADMAVAVPLSFLPLRKWIPTPSILQINSTAHDPDGNQLDYETIQKIMEGTTEIIKDKVGRVLIPIIFVFIILQYPLGLFGSSNDGCNTESYKKWYDSYLNGDGSAVDGCKGPNLCGGIPCWTLPAFVLFPINKLLIAFAMTRWKTIDEQVPGFPWGRPKTSDEQGKDQESDQAELPASF